MSAPENRTTIERALYAIAEDSSMADAAKRNVLESCAAHGFVLIDAAGTRDLPTEQRFIAALAISQTSAMQAAADLVALREAGLEVIDAAQLAAYAADVATLRETAAKAIQEAAAARAEVATLREWQRRAVPPVKRSLSLVQSIMRGNGSSAGDSAIQEEATRLNDLLAEAADGA